MLKAVVQKVLHAGDLKIHFFLEKCLILELSDVACVEVKVLRN
jgi:hypothetical protein